MSIVSCGWCSAAVATPVAGEAPQRRKVTPIFAALCGSIGSTIPASCSTFSSKAESATDWRALEAMELSNPIGPGSLFGIDRSDRYAGDSLAPADPVHALVAGRLDRDSGRSRLGE